MLDNTEAERARTEEEEAEEEEEEEELCCTGSQRHGVIATLGT